MAKKVVDGLFVGCVLLLLTAGLVTAVFFPRDVNAYENRYAAKLPRFTLSGYLDGSFQEGVDAALSDQVNFAQYYKKLYNLTASQYLKIMYAPVQAAYMDRYINFMGVEVFNGYILYDPRELEYITGQLEARAEHDNRCFAAHPEIEFYVYFIEKDTDINFQTGREMGSCGYLFDRLDLPEGRKARFHVESFEQFRNWFYCTDHHWNCDGSYQAYTELLQLLGVEDEPLAPQGDAVYLGDFSGSKALGMTSTFTEPFYAYRFDFPEMEISVNGNAGAGYGWQEGFLSGQGGRPSYGGFYGGDDGEVALSSGRPGRENLLILGESYDNAVLKLLASHFNVTYAVDLRYYQAYMGKEFDFSSYVEEHGITKVLIMGNLDYFLMPEFQWEG